MKIKAIVSDYVESIFTLQTEIKFWEHFLEAQIERYVGENEERAVYTSTFTVYNRAASDSQGVISTYEKPKEINISDLKSQKDEFFDWIKMLFTVRAYNSLEHVLLRSIQEKYFPSLNDPLSGKKHLNKLLVEIDEWLNSNGLSTDKKNNRHLIVFILSNCSDCATFYNQFVRSDLSTTWTNFFELISIIRNVVAHQALLINQDIINQFKSIGNPVFKRYFFIDEVDGLKLLKSKRGTGDFSNLINVINDFALNTVKFIYGKQNLDFIGFEDFKLP